MAQASGPQGPGAGPANVISVAKPQGEQSIALHLDGSTKLDLSQIADENITLIHIGDRLIILFDNHSQVTVEPFFDDRGQPIADLAVELGPGRDVSAAAFATLFPITDDPAVLPASGAPGAPSGGANFVSFTIDSLAPAGTPLALLIAEGGNGNNGEATTGQTNLQIVPMSLTDAKIIGAADEGGLVTDTIGTVGNHQGVPVTASGIAGSLDALVNFGTGGPSGTPFRFVSTADANTWLAKLGLESHGEPIDVATITGNTLVASTDPLIGQPHDVFSLTIHADGSWEFTLLAPLDDATGQGINTATIDLSGLIQAFDVVGLSITLSNDFRIVVTDDVPVLASATASGSVEEAGLVGGASPGDQFGSGTDPQHEYGLAVVSGSLIDLVAFGADGPATMSFQGPLEGSFEGTARPSLSFVVPDGFQFAVATGAHDFAVSSHGDAVDYVTVSGSSGFEMLTAWTEGGAGHEVFTLQLLGDGTYIFTLINPLDHAGDNAGAVTLDLSALIKAVDFDGDAITLSGDFTITIADDAPALTGRTTSGAVNEDGLSSASGDLFGDGNVHGDQVVITTATLPGLVNFGADGPAIDQSGGNSGFRFVVSNGSTFDFGVTSHGQAVDFVTLSAVTDSADGAEQTLTAWTNGGADHGGHAVFTLTLDGDGNYKFTLINPLDEEGSFTTLDLSRLIEAVDFDGDTVTLAPSSFTIGVNDDAPVLTGNAATGSVSEGALGFSAAAAGDRFGDGNDQHHDSTSTVFSGSLSGLVSFGADGQALTPDGHPAGFRLAVADGDTHDFHVTSHGAEVDTVAVADGEGTQTLTAWTHGGPDGGGHAVFTLTLGADGSYTFTLINPLDDTGPNGAAVTLDLSSLIQAVDFDGDAVTLSGDFTITVGDDAPTLTAAASGSVDEGGLTAATDPYGTGTHTGAAAEASGTLGIHFGADGPAGVTPGPVTFTDQANAANNIAVTDADGHAVALADLTSHGAALHFMLLNPSTLVAFTGTDAADPVFTVTLSATAQNGAYDFVLDKPLDQPLAGPDAFNLTFSYTARDFDGDTASGTFTVTATDDVPSITAAASGSVDESGLTSATDSYGTGTEVGSASFAIEASGALGVHLGADGPTSGTFTGPQTIDFSAAAAHHTFRAGEMLVQTVIAEQFNNISHIPDGAVYGAGTAASPVVVTDDAGPFVVVSMDLISLSGSTAAGDILLTGLDAQDNVIASTTVHAPGFNDLLNGTGPSLFEAAGTAFEGLAIAKLVISPVDPQHADTKALVDNLPVIAAHTFGPVSFADEMTAANNMTVTDGYGNALDLAGLTSHGQAVHFAFMAGGVLVAYTGSAPTAVDADNVVFAVTLSGATPDGSYDFVLHQPLDQALTGADALNFTFSYTAHDFDGDAATGSFTVTTTDDVPVIAAADAGSVFEAGLTSATDPYGVGSHAGSASFATAATGSLGVHFGADGPLGGNLQTIDFSVSSGDATFTAENVLVQTHLMEVLSNFGGIPNGAIYGAGTAASPVVVTDDLGPFILVSANLMTSPATAMAATSC